MKKTILVSFCVVILLTIPFLTIAEPEIAPVDGPDDPDGPYEGGLDDPTDWWNLGNGVILLGYMGIEVVTTDIIDMNSMVELIKWVLLFFGLLGLPTIGYFTEAFDIWDLNRDDC